MVEEHKSFLASASVSTDGSPGPPLWDEDFQEFYSSFRIFNAPLGEVLSYSLYSTDFQGQGAGGGLGHAFLTQLFQLGPEERYVSWNSGMQNFGGITTISLPPLTLPEGVYDFVVRVSAYADVTPAGLPREIMATSSLDVRFWHPPATIVPEPSSAVLLALGAGAVGLLVPRSRRDGRRGRRGRNLLGGRAGGRVAQSRVVVRRDPS